MNGATGSLIGGVELIDRTGRACAARGPVEVSFRYSTGIPLALRENRISWDPVTDWARAGAMTKRDAQLRHSSRWVVIAPAHPGWAPYWWQNYCGKVRGHAPPLLLAAVRLPSMHLELPGHPGANPLGTPRCDVPKAPSSFVIGPLEHFPET